MQQPFVLLFVLFFFFLLQPFWGKLPLILFPRDGLSGTSSDLEPWPSGGIKITEIICDATAARSGIWRHMASGGREGGMLGNRVARPKKNSVRYCTFGATAILP